MPESHPKPPTREQADASLELSSALPPRRFHFDQLAHGQAEIWIEFRGQTYRLRVTRNGKLILNK